MCHALSPFSKYKSLMSTGFIFCSWTKPASALNTVVFISDDDNDDGDDDDGVGKERRMKRKKRKMRSTIEAKEPMENPFLNRGRAYRAAKPSLGKWCPYFHFMPLDLNLK